MDRIKWTVCHRASAMEICLLVDKDGVYPPKTVLVLQPKNSRDDMEIFLLGKSDEKIYLVMTIGGWGDGIAKPPNADGFTSTQIALDHTSDPLNADPHTGECTKLLFGQRCLRIGNDAEKYTSFPDNFLGETRRWPQLD
tara:strand:- start:356 stop:772 length:417 start_codon:yes stop_codon:yes gene_type:complete